MDAPPSHPPGLGVSLPSLQSPGPGSEGGSGSGAEAPPVPPRYSVVVPVFNEAAAIADFCRTVRRELPPGYELLICYDFEEDDTLPTLAALPPGDRPPGLRLVRNHLGRGARFAIEAGMRAASAPVVLVTMVDLSDDYSRTEEMVSRVEAGCDVVCASRYMRGGRQIGGPWLKGLLSRTAGLSLHWLAGLPSHDPTNSFKAYRRAFLEATPIESTAGFCLALELTVKAHFGGGRVAEVPAVWRDRVAGKSRFRLARWLPLYLRWYLWALRRRWLRPRRRATGALFQSSVSPLNHEAASGELTRPHRSEGAEGSEGSGGAAGRDAHTARTAAGATSVTGGNHGQVQEPEKPPAVPDQP